MLAPSLYSDVDGQYRGLDGNIHKTGNFANYFTFSLWDTFRGAHPLYTIMHTRRSSDFINAMMSHYHDNRDSLLPVWSLWGNETFCMTGYHSVPVITDAILKGIGGFNVEEAYKAMKKSSMENIRNCDLYRKYGYIPFDSANVRSHGQGNESASNTLEYAYDDWCIAQVAQKLGKTEEYNYYMKRSEAYKLLFDPQTRLIRPRNADGSWQTPFRPNYAQPGNGFTEGNSWQHSWFVPHDVPGLIKSMGGEKIFTERLDSLFHQPTTESGFIDVSGLIGQYAHGNEPVHHVAYLYNYAGKPEKTQEALTLIVDSLYKTGPEGLCGNDDCGQMSAWYVLTAIGFYPVNAASGDFDIGRPFISKVELRLENGKIFTIQALNLSKTNIHVSKVSLNDKEIKDWKINYKNIMAGGKLIFVMKE
jgi:predicted alpha-1,2-mannosidase